MEGDMRFEVEAPLSDEAVVKALFGVSIEKLVYDFKCGKYDKTLAEINETA